MTSMICLKCVVDAESNIGSVSSKGSNKAQSTNVCAGFVTSNPCMLIAESISV